MRRIASIIRARLWGWLGGPALEADLAHYTQLAIAATRQAGQLSIRLGASTASGVADAFALADLRKKHEALATERNAERALAEKTIANLKTELGRAKKLSPAKQVLEDRALIAEQKARFAERAMAAMRSESEADLNLRAWRLVANAGPKTLDFVKANGRWPTQDDQL